MVSAQHGHVCKSGRSGGGKLGRTVFVCVLWGCKSGRASPSWLLGWRKKKKSHYLAKQDLRTEKVWSFISQQIQIRILIQPLNPVYPFNPRLGVCIRMWARIWGGGGGLWGICRFILERAKNTALYVFVFIKHDEWSHYINTTAADSRGTAGKRAAKTGRDWAQGGGGGAEPIPVDGTLSALWSISTELLTDLSTISRKTASLSCHQGSPRSRGPFGSFLRSKIAPMLPKYWHLSNTEFFFFCKPHWSLVNS